MRRHAVHVLQLLLLLRIPLGLHRCGAGQCCIRTATAKLFTLSARLGRAAVHTKAESV